MEGKEDKEILGLVTGVLSASRGCAAFNQDS